MTAEPLAQPRRPAEGQVWQRVARRLVERHAVDVFVRDLEGPLPQFPVAPHVELRRIAGAGDVSLLPTEHRRSARRKLARGDTAWCATVDGRLAGWLWVSRTSHRDPWSGLWISLASDEAYTYAWWVAPEHRKDGVAAALMATVLTDLSATGTVRRVYGWADRENKTSQFQLRLLFGFTRTQEIERMRVLDRWGRAVPGSAEPADGPLSCGGRPSRRAARRGRR